MQYSKRTFFFVLFLTKIGISACQENTVVNETASLDISTTETVKATLPPNCPVILATQHVPVGRWRENPSLNIWLTPNGNYDSILGDACKGDLKNLWPDLLRFENEIESYKPYINGINGIATLIEAFPQTINDVKDHVNSFATEYGLNEKMDQIDRSTAHGKNSVKRELRGFLNKSVSDYWLNEHGPIIENLLSEHDVKLRHYSHEKSKFCYDRFEYCSCYPWGYGDYGDDCNDVSKENRKASSGKYDFEVFPWGAYGSIGFHKPD